MKAKVLKRFKDKYSGRTYQEGEIITISKERCNEILKVAPLVEEIKPKKPEKAVE